MKKSLLLLFTLLLTGISFSQVIFSENFDAGTSLPAGWAQYNVDGLTPDAGVAALMGTNAWVVRTNAATGSGNHVTSTSWYNPVGTSNDWLVSPTIAIPPTGTYILELDAQAVDPNFLDGFKVYVSTTGNAVANFSAPAILTQTAATATYTTYGVVLSASYAGTNINIGIQNNSNDKFLLNVDNVVVRQLYPDNANLISANLNRFAVVNTNSTLALTVKNDGSNPITSLTIDWNDGSAHSSVIPCNIAPQATLSVNHPTAITYATALEKSIAITITSVNGNTDPNTADNTASKQINTVSQAPDKTVVIEEGTGTWCGWCPRGAVAMEYLENAHPDDFIGIAVHNADPMTLTAYDAAAAFTGFPGCNVDRVFLGQGVSNPAFDAYYNARTNLVMPAAIAANATIAGSSITIDVTATFYTPFAAANYRLGVIMTEDNVHGTSAAYDQHNYYSSADQNLPLVGAGHNWQTEQVFVPATTMSYDHVGRALLGGYNGQSGSVPATITDGQVANYTFNYTVPSTSARFNMHAVAVLIDQSTGEIMNAKKIALTSAGIEEAETIAMQVYPNPATDVVNVKFEGQGGNYTVSITDLSGREMGISTVSNANGSQNVALAVDGLAGGNYLVTIATEGASYTQQVVVR